MATNINSNGGLDTSDATATANKIMPGYTAYVDGNKITGTATSDATATAARILSGYTAYVNGNKITGSYSPAIAYKYAIGIGYRDEWNGTRTYCFAYINSNGSVNFYANQDSGFDCDIVDFSIKSSGDAARITTIRAKTNIQYNEGGSSWTSVLSGNTATINNEYIIVRAVG